MVQNAIPNMIEGLSKEKSYSITQKITWDLDDFSATAMIVPLLVFGPFKISFL